MDANAVNAVVDKLAEKIGGAADKLAPLAAEAVRQVQALGLAYTIVGALCVAFAAFAFTMCLRYVRKAGETNEEVNCIAAVVCGVLGLWCLTGGLGGLLAGLCRWLAPYAHLLGK